MQGSFDCAEHSLRECSCFAQDDNFVEEFSFSQLFEEAADGFDSPVEVWDVELFVGGVQVVVGQAEAHHYTGNFQDVLEVSDDGNRAAAADEDRLFLERVVQGFRGGFDVAVVGADYAGRPFAVHFDFCLDAFGGELLHERGVFFKYFVWILIGH